MNGPVFQIQEVPEQGDGPSAQFHIDLARLLVADVGTVLALTSVDCSRDGVREERLEQLERFERKFVGRLRNL